MLAGSGSLRGRWVESGVRVGVWVGCMVDMRWWWGFAGGYRAESSVRVEVWVGCMAESGCWLVVWVGCRAEK